MSTDNPRRIMVISDRSGAEADNAAFLKPDDANDIRIVTVDDSIDALTEYARPHLIVVDLMACDEPAMTMLDEIEAMAVAQNQRVIVIFPKACIDTVVALLSAPSITLLCDPSAVERMAALTFAIESTRDRFLNKTDEVPERLQSLTDEVARIAKALAALAGEGVLPGGDMFSDGLVGYRAEPSSNAATGAPVSAGEVRAMIRARRLRDRFLPPDLFADPAWDMLLDLFAARIERTKVAVSSLCIAAAVPPTTALRMIATLTARGMILRIDDAEDRRRVFIQLSDSTAEAMRDYVATARTLVA
jgi:hypothetical protein